MISGEHDNRIRELVDRERIARLPNLYCQYIRAKNVEAVLDLFVEDGQIIVHSDAAWAGRFCGRSAIGDMLRDGIERNGPWPFSHNHIVDLVDEGNATGRVHAEVRMGIFDLKVASVGTYEDEYVRLEDGAWKFKSRVYTSITLLPEPQPHLAAGEDRRSIG